MRGHALARVLVATLSFFLCSFGPGILAQDTADLTDAPSASANLRHGVARLKGTNEVPATGSSAYGYARVILNDAETQITVSANWEGLTSNTTAAHIQTCAAGVSGPVTFGFNPPTGATSGSVSNIV